ncbi:hypothetical protein EDF88_3923 [Buttiauxella sp. BIGb0552]|nr:hypothetical protein EDF88_3923 [Buttiauxella sp. BIGb0552]
MDNVVLAIKMIAMFYIFMLLLPAAINMADTKANRPPWKRVYATTFRMLACMTVLALVCAAISYVIF